MMLQEVGAEYGTTTGRRRRCGWLDLVPWHMSRSSLKKSHTGVGWPRWTHSDVDIDKVPGKNGTMYAQVMGRLVPLTHSIWLVRGDESAGVWQTKSSCT